MKILYAAGMSPNDSSFYRLLALERQGHTVLPLNAFDYESSNATIRKIAFRLSMGPGVGRLNHDLLQLAERERPDALWADKLLWMWPETLDKLRRMGIASVSYMIDNAFGPRRDPGWRLYRKGIPHYDLHVVQRDRNIAEYRQAGRTRRHQDPDSVRADHPLSAAGRVERPGPRPGRLLYWHAV